MDLTAIPRHDCRIVQAELGKPSALHPDKGKVSIFVDCSAVAEPTFEVFPLQLSNVCTILVVALFC